MVFAWCNKYISISNGFGSFLTNFASFCSLNAVNSSQLELQLTWQKRWETWSYKISVNTFCSSSFFFLLTWWSQWGSLWEYTSRTEKNRKLSKFPESKIQTTGDRNVFIEPKKLLFRPLKNIIFLPWYVKSDSFQEFLTIWWARESETICVCVCHFSHELQDFA